MIKPNRSDKICDNKKTKYRTNALDRELKINNVMCVPGMLPTTKNNQSNNINVESYLRNSRISSKKKGDFVLDTDENNKNKDYRNFGMTNISRKVILNTGNYVTTGYKGHGRGFSTKGMGLRDGQNTRQTNENITSIEMDDYRFHELFRNYQNPNNVVLPFPRGGIDTRNLDKYSKNNISNDSSLSKKNILNNLVFQNDNTPYMNQCE